MLSVILNGFTIVRDKLAGLTCQVQCPDVLPCQAGNTTGIEADPYLVVRGGYRGGGAKGAVAPPLSPDI